MFWDFGGQAEYAAAQQPFLAGDALYLLVVPAVKLLKSEEIAHRPTVESDYGEVAGRWLQTLRTRTPGAVVQLVVSKVDLASSEAVDELCDWLRARVQHENELRLGTEDQGSAYRQQEGRSSGGGALKIQSRILLATAVEGPCFASSSTKIFSAITELVRVDDPPLLRSVGMEIPVSWQAVVVASETHSFSERSCHASESNTSPSPLSLPLITTGDSGTSRWRRPGQENR